MKGVTVLQLYKMCKKQIELGNGNKNIIMTSDDEANEFHQAWEGLNDGSDFKNYIQKYQLASCISDNIEDYVVLT